MNLIERLNNYRLKNKITQQELAKKLGVTFATVNRWINRKNRPSQIQYYHIKELLSEGNKKQLANNKVFNQKIKKRNE